MVKRAHIVINLLPEASDASSIQIEELIKKGAKIPLCSEIENVSVEDIEKSYMNLKNHGISSSVVKNIIDLYIE